MTASTPPTPKRLRFHPAWWLVALLFGMAFLGSRGLWSPDEGRYVEVAVEMLDSHDWLTPRVHHEFEHFSKPPMTYWSVAASMGSLGRSEWTARLPGGLAWLACVWLLVSISRRLNGGDGFRVGVVFALMPLPYLAASLVTTDMLLCAFEVLQAYAFVHLWWATDDTEARRMRWLLGFAAGMAFLTKGPPGLFPLLVFLLFAYSMDGMRGIRSLFNPLGLLALFGIGFSWYLAVIIAEPALLRHFLVDEVWNRVAAEGVHRNPQWYGGFRVYLPTLLLGLLPGSLFLLWKLVRRGIPFRSLWRKRGEAPINWLLFLWLAVPLTIFFLARSRLPLYLLPLAPAFALLIDRLLPARLPRTFGIALSVILASLLVGVRLYAAQVDHSQDDRALALALQQRFGDSITHVGELAFVESAPRMGLAFYLGEEVERLNLPDGDIPEPQSQSLSSELLEDEGCRLLLTDEEHVDALRLALSGVGSRDLGLVRGYRLMVAADDRCPDLN